MFVFLYGGRELTFANAILESRLSNNINDLILLRRIEICLGWDSCVLRARDAVSHSTPLRGMCDTKGKVVLCCAVVVLGRGDFYFIYLFFMFCCYAHKGEKVQVFGLVSAISQSSKKPQYWSWRGNKPRWLM